MKNVARRSFHKISPVGLVFVYMGAVLAFSGIYALFPTEHRLTGTCSESIWGSLYFSIVTITTLGYGDCSPVGLLKAVAALEALLGVALIGLLVSSIWNRVLDSREVKSAQDLAFNIYSASLRFQLIQYQFCIAELLVHDIDIETVRDDAIEKINPDFSFVDLKGFDEISRHYSQSSKLELFRSELNSIVSEFQSLIVRLNLKGLDELIECIARFISVAKTHKGYNLLLDQKYGTYCRSIAYKQIESYELTQILPDTNKIKEEEKALVYLASLLDSHIQIIGEIHSRFLALPKNNPEAVEYLCTAYPNTYRKAGGKNGFVHGT